MTELLPPRFLFRFSLPLRRVPKLPRTGRQLLKLPAECTLPDFAGLDQDAGPTFGQLRGAWNADGLGFSVEVRGKQRPLSCDPRLPFESDGLNLWIDTRNTQSIHRASRFCHHFTILPAGGGTSKKEPSARQWPIARAREETPLAKPEDLRVAVEHFLDGYLLEAWLPGDVLQGFDTETNPRLGFYYALSDSELGEQYLGVGPEFPFAYDPSLWWTLELAS